MSTSPKPLEIRIRTYDNELKAELEAYLQSQGVTDVVIRKRIEVLDGGDMSFMEPLLTFLVPVAQGVSSYLIGDWLVKRFSKKPPKTVAVNNQPMAPEQITVVINNYYGSKPEDSSS